MEQEIEAIIRALNLCGWEYTPQSCTICPYCEKCLPGDNTPLLADTAALLVKIKMLLKGEQDERKDGHT